MQHGLAIGRCCASVKTIIDGVSDEPTAYGIRHTALGLILSLGLAGSAAAGLPWVCPDIPNLPEGTHLPQWTWSHRWTYGCCGRTGSYVGQHWTDVIPLLVEPVYGGYPSPPISDPQFEGTLQAKHVNPDVSFGRDPNNPADDRPYWTYWDERFQSRSNAGGLYLGSVRCPWHSPLGTSGLRCDQSQPNGWSEAYGWNQPGQGGARWSHTHPQRGTWRYAHWLSHPELWTGLGVQRTALRLRRPDGRVEHYSNTYDPTLRTTVNTSWHAAPNITSRLETLTDATGAWNGLRYTDAQDTVETYDLDGQLLRVTTRQGLSHHYSHNGNQTVITDDFGRTLTRTETTLDVRAPDGSQHQVQFNADGDVSAVLHPDGAQTTLA